MVFRKEYMAHSENPTKGTIMKNLLELVIDFTTTYRSNYSVITKK